ncbi:cytoplasmic dynein 1 intermediate chain isoform X10 [Spodoptera frugiperda]|uniref:Cytoplasmic dynein 1 intermediate chain isoform X10 n=1 Tax=Spodoptera frugiperda TaxID=7108 RepID=A0A9R0EBX1_SPOFR|nr:cytoplasmic dynein 1 intermediate chain isoform X10 [Spodoptera frugiperda]XP_050562436.1 cytoplasmic dynein 1 intermediate chain isoform X10 [Spodoptera frugiperda]
MSSMSDRKAELERKKAKLQALREEKDRRRREKEQKDAEEALQRASATSSLDSRRDLDEMLSSLGVAPVKDVLSSLSSMTSLTPPQTASPDASLPHTDKSSLPAHGGPKKAPTLQVVSVQSTDIPPKENVTYAKQTQTTASGVSELRDGYMEDWWRPRKAHATDYYVLTFDGDGARQGDEEEAAFHGKLPPGILPHGLPTVKEVQPAVTVEPQEKKDEEKEKKVRELSADEKQTIMLSAEFQRFMSKAGRVIERALAESVDIYTDYTGGGDSENALDDKSVARLSLVRTFWDERWSRGRCVTCCDWSAAHPELLLASYHNSDDAPHDPDGVCLVWNTKFKKSTPEDIFHCQSPVMSATFARFHPNLILGGTYSGQIVLWDNRVQKRTPIQRTPLSSLAHTHPVYCLSVVGSQNAHNLISVSTDGRMCSWSLDMLSQPQETLDLQHRQSKAVAVTSMGFPHGDVNNFVLGSEDGNIYTGCLYGQRAGVTEMVEGHAGPITGVSCHAAAGSVDLSHLYLTCSMDWSVKLWTQKENKALYSFEDSGDYVVDVRWSPTHPALFAAADASGRIDLWNLNRDTEVPVASIQAEGGVAFNRVSWTPSGTHITAGDDAGKIWVYEVAEHVAQPRHDEWTKFVYTLQELRNNQADEETDRLSLAASGPSSLTSLTSMASNPLR